jgi:hypothetical protein
MLNGVPADETSGRATVEILIGSADYKGWRWNDHVNGSHFKTKHKLTS